MARANGHPLLATRESRRKVIGPLHRPACATNAHTGIGSRLPRIGNGPAVGPLGVVTDAARFRQITVALIALRKFN
jgi:hypothetical protein